MAQRKKTRTPASKKAGASAGKRASAVKGKKKSQSGGSGLRSDILLLLLLAISVLLVLGNFGLGGVVGKSLSWFCFGIFGILEYIFPFFLFLAGAVLIANRKSQIVAGKIVGAAGVFCFACALFHLLTVGYSPVSGIRSLFYDSAGDRQGGGLVGGGLAQLTARAFGTVGAYVVIVAALAIFAIIMTQKPLLSRAREKGAKVRMAAKEHREEAELRREERQRQKSLEREALEKRRRKQKTEQELEEVSKNSDFTQQAIPDFIIERSDIQSEETASPAAETEEQKKRVSREHSAAGEVRQESAEKLKKQPKSSASEIEAGIQNIREEISSANDEKRRQYETPPLSLLDKGSGGQRGDSDAHLRETAIKLQQTLHNFGVDVTVTNVSCGPTVTRYELQPEQGVKVSRIVSLADDIKLNLAAADIRIEAPIPGKAAVGIEVPNKTNSSVTLRSLLESSAFRRFPSKLAFAVGKDIAGQPVITDIAKMPHLLIAGATGSGKSVCINTLIMSILYKASPDEVKLIMIDPKVVELSVYNGIPHLYIPVVTDPKKAAGALNWAVSEMTDRYNRFAEYNVRDLAGYNAKIQKAGVAEGEESPKALPQIVIIVDELADLMMVAPGEVEDAICRLAQLARAAGLHLIIATQRPSVNVITGLIKANMPSRIALAVASGVDSRTILDMNGAEKLLGKGDMLFYPQGYQKPARVQGAYVSDDEIVKVVQFLSEHSGEQAYDPEIEKKINSTAAQTAGGPSAGEERDAYFADAGRFIIEKDKASIGMLQRAFRIGFNRAARIMEQLSEAGVVGEEEGTKPRKILMSMEQFENYLEEA